MPAHLSSPTNAEKKLARALKEKRWSFERNQIVEGYEVDFLLPEIRLIIEVDGYTHLSDRRLQLDLAKEKRLVEKGYLLLRFTNQQIREQLPQCLREIEKIIQAVAAGQKKNTINDGWKEKLRQVAVPKEERPGTAETRRKPLSIEEYFLSKEE